MDLLAILSSLNKISLVAFFITTVFLGYQIYGIKKELSRKRNKPTIPDFDDKVDIKKVTQAAVLTHQKQISTYKQKNGLYVTVLLIFLITFLAIFTFSGIANIIMQKKTVMTIIPNSDIDFVASKGIRVYNENWKELTDEDLQKLSKNQKILIGIETIKGTDVDKARIKINKDVWQDEDVTEDFNNGENVFYKEYIIGTHSGMLKIDAQLHSKSEGWLIEKK